MRWILAVALLAGIHYPTSGQDLGDNVTADSLAAFFDKLKADETEPRYPLLSVENLKTGHVGRIPYDRSAEHYVRTSVFRVIDEQSFVMQVDIYRAAGETKVAAVERFSTNRPSSSGRPAALIRTLAIIVKGTNTTDVADGKRMTLTNSWKVTGTGTYESRGDKRTAHVIEPTRIALPE